MPGRPEPAVGGLGGPLGAPHVPKETKAQRAERLKAELNPWEHLEEIRRFAREGFESIPAEWLNTYFRVTVASIPADSVLGIVVAGVVIGSMVFSLNNVVTALGANQDLPVILAAWAIPICALASGNAALLYMEDG